MGRQKSEWSPKWMTLFVLGGVLFWWLVFVGVIYVFER